MAVIIVGEKVINKANECGEIISFDEKYFYVAFNNRNAQFLHNAFEQGYLKYVNPNFQEKINSDIQKVQEEKNKEMLEKEEQRRISEKEKEIKLKMEKELPIGVSFDSNVRISKRFDPVKVALSSVLRKHKDLVQQIFKECDDDVNQYVEDFHPNMSYPVPKGYYSHSLMHIERKAIPCFRSRYCVGFLSKYFDTYVFRVFSRNDIYKLGYVGGSVIHASDTTEIFRIIYVDGKTYYFSKHFSVEWGRYQNTTLYNKWQASSNANFINLDNIIKKCDCNYLDNYIEIQKVNCFQYLKLLFPALTNNKAEILFKKCLFSPIVNIENIEDYLSEFSNKQIDFACNNNCINALPFIKKYSVQDLNILSNIEYVMKKNKNSNSTYGFLKELFIKYNLDLDVLDKNLIGFFKKIDNFNPIIYRDYIINLFDQPEVNIDIIFAKDYIDRHDIIMMEKHTYCSPSTIREYSQIAKELSWIDREENGYYIMVPKTIEEFKKEGQIQHNCLFTNRYFLEVINRYSIIVFLRKEPTKSYVTIEFVYGTFEVIQAYGKYNREIDEELYDYIVNLGKDLAHEFSTQE